MRQVSGKSQIWNVEELLQEVNGKKWKGKEEKATRTLQLHGMEGMPKKHRTPRKLQRTEKK